MTNDLLERLAAANPVPEHLVADSVRHHAAREMLQAIIGEAQPGQRRGPRRPRLRAITPLAAAAALLAVALMVGPLSRVGPGGPQAEAAEVLRRAAETAARQPAQAVPAGSYRYTKSRSTYLHTVQTQVEDPEDPSAIAEGPAISALRPSVREIWIAPDGSGRIVETTDEYIFFSQEDRDAWEAAGLKVAGGSHSELFGPGGLHYVDLGGLPTDPDELEEVLRGRTEGRDSPISVGMFVAVGDLLRETAAPPELRSALFQVAARIDGVVLIGRVTDAAGRPGVAVGLETDHSGWRERKVLIFDPATSALLAETDTLMERVEWLDAEPPVTIGAAVYLESGIVSSTSERPTNAAGPPER